MNDNKVEDIILKECIVGHIDILGSKENIEIDEKSFINSLKEVIRDSKELCNGYNESKYKKAKYFYKIFSDNICLYAELPKATNSDTERDRWNNIVFMLLLLSAIQYSAIMKQKILMRGGIAIGNLYCNEDFIIGKSLSKAYTLESKEAIYSRILVDENIIKDRFYHESNKLEKFLEKDTDGNFMLNYLLYTDNTALTCGTKEDNLLTHKNILLEKLNSANSETVKEKILSIILYHNRYCKKLKFDYGLIEI